MSDIYKINVHMIIIICSVSMTSKDLHTLMYVHLPGGFQLVMGVPPFLSSISNDGIVHEINHPATEGT